MHANPPPPPTAALADPGRDHPKTDPIHFFRLRDMLMGIVCVSVFRSLDDLISSSKGPHYRLTGLREAKVSNRCGQASESSSAAR